MVVSEPKPACLATFVSLISMQNRHRLFPRHFLTLSKKTTSHKCKTLRNNLTQPAFVCLKLTIETVQGVKYIQS